MLVGMMYIGDGWAIGADGSRRWGTLGAAGLLLYTVDPDEPERLLVLMQHRAPWTNRGDTWALPGGAIDVGESVEEGALRETWEETGVNPSDVMVDRTIVTTRIPLKHTLRRVPIEPEDEPLLDPIKSMIERDGDVAQALRDHPIIHPEHGGRAVFGLGARFWWEIPDATASEWTYSTVIGHASELLELNPTEESQDLTWWPLDTLEELNLMPDFLEDVPMLRKAVTETAKQRGILK